MRIFGFNASCLLLVIAHLKITKSEGTILSPCTLPTKPPNHRTCLKLERLSSGTQLCLPNPFRAKLKQIVFIWGAEAFGRKKIPSTVFSRRCVWAKPFALTPTQLLVKRRKEEKESPVVACCLSFTIYSFLTVHLYSVNLLQYTSTDKIIVFFFFTFVDRKTESKGVCYLWTFRLRLM